MFDLIAVSDCWNQHLDTASTSYACQAWFCAENCDGLLGSTWVSVAYRVKARTRPAFALNIAGRRRQMINNISCGLQWKITLDRWGVALTGPLGRTVQIADRDIKCK